MSAIRTFFLPVLLLSVAAEGISGGKNALRVTATAYNSVPGQTQGNPRVTAWGERLVPGMQAIAVSRDLLAKGLAHGTEVRIDGMPGTYRVMDKLNKRWTRRIDIYMGTDVEAAKAWGNREVTIRW